MTVAVDTCLHSWANQCACSHPIVWKSGDSTLTIAPGDLLALSAGRVGTVVEAFVDEWRFSRKPRLRIAVAVPDPFAEDETYESLILVHPDLPERWPKHVHEFHPEHEGCQRCGALPGESMVCEAPAVQS